MINRIVHKVLALSCHSSRFGFSSGHDSGKGGKGTGFFPRKIKSKEELAKEEEAARLEKQESMHKRTARFLKNNEFLAKGEDSLKKKSLRFHKPATAPVPEEPLEKPVQFIKPDIDDVEDELYNSTIFSMKSG